MWIYCFSSTGTGGWILAVNREISKSAHKKTRSEAGFLESEQVR